MGDWNFASESGADLSGNWSTFTLNGTASFSSDALVVSGNGNGANAATAWAKAGGYSGPTLSDKTLVSWVKLDRLDITSGAPLSLYRSAGGDVFDTITYGETQQNQWRAGSDNSARSPNDFSPGFVDNFGPDVVRQVAISYQGTGGGNQTITGCLNGNQLGQYATNNTATFASTDQPLALFGPRHENTSQGGAPVGSIDAHILETRIYSGAMTCQQVAALSPTGVVDPTSTSVTCAPATVTVGQPTTCTATVTDTDTDGPPTTPTGAVGFASSTSGAVSAPNCTLGGSAGSSTCSVTYTPSSAARASPRTDTIIASYAGDSAHQASSTRANVAVNARAGALFGPGGIPAALIGPKRDVLRDLGITRHRLIKATKKGGFAFPPDPIFLHAGDTLTVVAKLNIGRRHGRGQKMGSAAVATTYGTGSVTATHDAPAQVTVHATPAGRAALNRNGRVFVSVHLAFRSSAKLGSSTASKDFRVKLSKKRGK